MPRSIFDTMVNGAVPEGYSLSGRVASGKNEYASCILAALRAKMRNPRDVKIHVLPSVGDGKLIPHVMWEETGRNGKRYIRDFWGSAPAERAAGRRLTQKLHASGKLNKDLEYGHAFPNRIFGRSFDSTLPLNFKGHVRKNVDLANFQAQIRDAGRASSLFHTALLGKFLGNGNYRKTLGALGAIAAGSAADDVLTRKLRNDKDYRGYNGSVGKTSGTIVGTLAGIPIASHLASLPAFHNSHIAMFGKAPRLFSKALAARTAAPGAAVKGANLPEFLKRIVGKLPDTLNRGARMSKGRTAALAALLGTAGMAGSVALGRGFGKTMDAGAKGVNYGIHKARQNRQG